eukprot:SAG11_NODE_2047_length_3884_cov_1.573844_7_plen_342_part_00
MANKNTELKQLPISGALSGLAIGLTTIISSTRCFGAERIVFWRESSSGLNHLAYFLGKNIAEVPRLFFVPLFYFVIFQATTAIHSEEWGTWALIRRIVCWSFYLLASPALTWITPKKLLTNDESIVESDGLESSVTIEVDQNRLCLARTVKHNNSSSHARRGGRVRGAASVRVGCLRNGVCRECVGLAYELAAGGRARRALLPDVQRRLRNNRQVDRALRPRLRALPAMLGQCDCVLPLHWVVCCCHHRMGILSGMTSFSYAYHMAKALYLLKVSQFIDFQVPENTELKFQTNLCPVDQVCVGWVSLKDLLQQTYSFCAPDPSLMPHVCTAVGCPLTLTMV